MLSFLGSVIWKVWGSFTMLGMRVVITWTKFSTVSLENVSHQQINNMRSGMNIYHMRNNLNPYNYYFSIDIGFENIENPLLLTDHRDYTFPRVDRLRATLEQHQLRGRNEPYWACLSSPASKILFAALPREPIPNPCRLDSTSSSQEGFSWANCHRTISQMFWDA